MKPIVIATIFALCAGVALHAGPAAVETLTIAAASTNANPITGDQATNSLAMSAYVDYVDVDISSDYASPTCTVKVATSGESGKATAQTILVKEISADTRFYPSVLFQTSAGSDVTGAARRFPLAAERIVVSAYGYNETNNDCEVTFRIGVSSTP